MPLLLEPFECGLVLAPPGLFLLDVYLVERLLPVLLPVLLALAVVQIVRHLAKLLHIRHQLAQLLLPLRLLEVYQVRQVNVRARQPRVLCYNLLRCGTVYHFCCF